MSNPDPTASPPQPHITLRAPTTSPITATATAFTPPPLPWLLGTWHVTHSTLPIWKKARNVSITYSALASSPEKLDDLVTYQSLSGGDKVKTVSGTDTPAGPGAWDWRGNGWLMIASSHWEVLGYGEVDGGGGGGGDGEQWVVTYFAKTLFTPAGIDIYSRRKEGLKESTLQAVKEALGRVDAEIMRGLLGSVFEVKRD